MSSVGIESTASKDSPEQGLDYLFVIAIDDYESSEEKPTFDNLVNPVRGASRLVEILVNKYTFDGDKKNSRVLNYPEPVIEYNTLRTRCLYNENATADNIMLHLEALEKELKETDNLLIYFSGHGVDDRINPGGSVIPFGGISTKKNTWCPLSWFYSLFGYPKCRDLLLILDSCFAGQASLGVPIRRNERFSRQVLASSSPNEKALDGVIYQGSPFANALCYILQENTSPFFSLGVKALTERFKWEYAKMYDDDPQQEIIYKDLPTECGLGDFVFELNVKDVPAPAVLARSFVEYLDFGKERKLVTDKFPFFSKADEHLIITREVNKHVHQLTRAVMFNELSKCAEGAEYAMKLDVSLHRYLPLDLNSGFDILAAFAAEFKADPKFNNADAIADNIVGQLLSAPLIISLHSEHLAKDFTDRIIDFLKGFSDTISKAKHKLCESKKEKVHFHKLFFVIPDSRDKGNDLFDEKDLRKIFPSTFNLLVNSPVEALGFGNAAQWLAKAKKNIGAQNLKALKPSELFPDEFKVYSCPLEFIYLVCSKVKVDTNKVTAAIISY